MNVKVASKKPHPIFSFEEAVYLLQVGAHGFTFTNQRGNEFFVQLDANLRPQIMLITESKSEAAQ